MPQSEQPSEKRPICRRPTAGMTSTELRLPHDLLQRASLRGSEYAWPIEDIPKVIEAARQANLASIGGQLQFRLPDGGTCEDPHKVDKCGALRARRLRGRETAKTALIFAPFTV